MLEGSSEGGVKGSKFDDDDDVNELLCSEHQINKIN
jgi:hypothetical protein